MIDPQLVSNALVFFREKPENAEMAAVVADVLQHLVVRLREVHDTAVAVRPVDEVIDLVWGLFANQIVEGDYLLVVDGQSV